jgi:hypothetical protein
MQTVADILKEDLDELTEFDLDQAIKLDDTDTAQKAIVAILARLIKPMIKKPIQHADGDHNEIDLFLGNALTSAAIHGRVAVGRSLLDAGVDPNIADGNAMLWAADKGHTAFVELLLERGADPSLNFNGAIGLARKNGHKDILALFKCYHIAKADTPTDDPATDVAPLNSIDADQVEPLAAKTAADPAKPVPSEPAQTQPATAVSPETIAPAILRPRPVFKPRLPGAPVESIKSVETGQFARRKPH